MSWIISATAASCSTCCGGSPPSGYVAQLRLTRRAVVRASFSIFASDLGHMPHREVSGGGGGGGAKKRGLQPFTKLGPGVWWKVRRPRPRLAFRRFLWVGAPRKEGGPPR